MPTQAAQALLSNPSFLGMPPEEQKKRLYAADPGFARLSPQAQDVVITRAKSRTGGAKSPAPATGMMGRVGEDINIGWRAGKAGLEQTAGNILTALPQTRDTGHTLQGYAAENAPTPKEMETHSNVLDKVIMGAAQTPATLAKYAPAMAGGRYAPFVAGAIGAAGEAHHGAAAAVQAGLRDIGSFALMEQAGEVPTMGRRMIASGMAAAIPPAAMGENFKDITAAALMGATFGMYGRKPGREPSPTERGASRVMESAARLREKAQTLVSPQNRSALAKETANVIRYHGSDSAQALNIAAHITEKGRKAIAQLGDIRAQWDFINKMQHGKAQASPELDEVSKIMREGLDEKRDTIIKENSLKKRDKQGNIVEIPTVLKNVASGLKSGNAAIKEWYENYFKNIWQDSDKAQGVISGFFAGKRPLPGPRTFLKPRKYLDIFAGLNLKDIEDAVDGAKKAGATSIKIESLLPNGNPSGRFKSIPISRATATNIKGAAASLGSSRSVQFKPEGFPKQSAGMPTPQALTQRLLDAGLTPVWDNAVDIYMHTIAELQRFIMAKRVIKELKGPVPGLGIARFVPEGYRGPSGYRKVNDPAFNVMRQVKLKRSRAGSPTTTHRTVMAGSYWLPEEAANVVENYLQRGLKDFRTFRNITAGNHLINYLQLSLSGFHLGFTAGTSLTSQMALGIERGIEAIGRGSPKMAAKAALSVAELPITVFKDFYTGNQIMKEWRKPGSQRPDIQNVVRLMKQAGARAEPDPIYNTHFARSMWDSFYRIEKGDLGQVVPAAIRLLPAGMEAVNSFVLQTFVPRMKLAAFSKLASFEMERLHPNTPLSYVREVMGKAWDSIDNRFGLMVYDNLFWNHYIKDMSMITFRSVGWNLGGFKEVGGAGIDSMEALRNFIIKKPTEFTHRMAFLAAMPIMAGLAGGITTYIMTGKRPEEIRDYYFPKTGGKDQYGQDERLNIPAYMSDLLKWFRRPGQTAKYKLSSWMWIVTEMLQNRDFFGTKIYNEDDPMVKEIIDFMKYLSPFGGQLEPISFRNIAKEKKAGYPIRDEALAFFGFAPAPAEIKKTPAMNMMTEMIAARGPQGAKTKKKAKELQTRSDIETAIRLGKHPEKVAAQGLQEGAITPDDIKTAMERASTNPLDRDMKSLTLEESLKVWKVANKKERMQMIPYIWRKMEKEGPKITYMNQDDRTDIMDQMYGFMKDARELVAEQ